MVMKHVEGTYKGKVMLYTLSTCIWCKKTKTLLNDLGVEYHYVDIDTLDSENKQKMLEEVKRWNPQCTFPSLVIDNETCIVGFKEESIKERLGT